MPGRRQLRRILFPTWPDMQGLADEWKAFIERCDTWSFGAGFYFRDGDGGKRVELRLPPSAVSAVVTTEITAAPDADTLGQGFARLRVRDGAALADGPIVKVYAHCEVAVPVGTRIEVCPDGADYKLVFAHYCPPA